MSAHRRSGLTLLELLIIVAILAILFALIGPAIMNGRDAANRAACKNNLKRLTQALNEYEATHRMYPPGFDSSTGFSWAGILVATGQLQVPEPDHSITKAVDTTLPLTDTSSSNLRFQATPIGINCPSMSNTDPREHGTLGKSGVWGYAGVPGYNSTISQANEGILYQDSNVSHSDVIFGDGASNTFIVGESNRFWAGTQPGELGAAEDVLATVGDPCKHDLNTINDPDRAIPLNSHDPRAFGSEHETGIHFAFAEGKVRFLSLKTNVGVLQFLSGYNDKVVVDDF